MFYASADGVTTLVKQLLAHPKLDKSPARLELAVYNAARNGHQATVEILLDAGADLGYSLFSAVQGSQVAISEACYRAWR